jgi:hypothetical protein
MLDKIILIKNKFGIFPRVEGHWKGILWNFYLSAGAETNLRIRQSVRRLESTMADEFIKCHQHIFN